MAPKIYGEEPTFAGPRIPTIDPDFGTDSQNNDEYYVYDTDAGRDVQLTSQPMIEDEPEM